VQESQVAVVTGGARGIGFAVATALAADGYHVVILDNGVQLDGTGQDAGPANDAVAQIGARGGSAEAAFCDAGDAAAVRATIADVLARHGRIDVLANVAGILRPGPFLHDTADTWAAVLSVHLGGHLNAIAAVLPGMLARHEGRIINITSTSALLGSRRQPAYSAAKQAVVGLTRVLAPVLARWGVAINAISPAAASRMSTGAQAAPDPDRDERSAELTDREPGHVGRFASWLAGPGAAGVTGRVFLVSGGYVIEYEHLRPWKWSAVPPGADPDQVAERVRWVLGRPHPTVIGPWPTRDFGLAEIDRQWEGTGVSAELAAAAAAAVGGGPGGPDAHAAGATGQPGAGWTAAVARVPGLPDVAVVGAAEGSSAAALLAGLRPGRPGADAAGGQAELTKPAAPPAGVIVFPSGCGPAAPPAAGTRDQGGLESAADVVLPPPGETCPVIVELLHQLQSALALAGRDGGRSVLVVLPPWRDDGALACALAWYAAVGLIRGTAATEAIYGVRVNGLVVERGHEQLGAAMAGYLLSEDSHWLNGYLLTADGLGAGVLSDERPRWQGHYPGAEFRLPAAIGRELGLHGS
jgi:NAD(P)-dependent dehydrogenase (short-subunit alcohol dehydrogenase family)